MPINYQFEEKGFVRSWIWANIIGTVVGVLIAFCIEIIRYRYVNDATIPWSWVIYLEHLIGEGTTDDLSILATILGGILVGNFLIGWGEQKIIKRHTHLNFGWFWATVTGVAIGAGLFCFEFAIPQISLLTFYIYRNLGLELGLLVLGISLTQWLVIRKVLSRSEAWIWIRVISLVCFVLVSIPLVLISWNIVYDLSEGNHYFFYYLLEPYLRNTGEWDYVVTYLLFLLFFPFPAAVSALIRGSFIKNRLKKLAQNSDSSGADEKAPLETPADGENNIP